jgi:radical SAM protein with 4Fe4S-binding SPASM domain
MSNIKYLLEAKKKARSKKPKIIWQFLVNKYNEHEIETAKKIADALKIIIDIRPIGLFDNEPDVKHGATSIEESKKQWLPQNDAYISDFYKGEWRYPLYKEICPSLFTRVVVMADGRIVPCCEIWDKENAFGNLLTQSFDEIWYGQTYIDARSRALNLNFSPQIKSVCFGCNRFEIRPSLIDKLRLVQFVFRKPVRKWWQQCWSYI